MMCHYLFDPEIHKMLIRFYQMSGIRVGIHDNDMNILTEYPPKSSEYEKLRFCDKFRYHSNVFAQKCLNCDLSALRQIQQTGKTLVYSCHFGLLEAVIPILSGNNVVCTLMIGQVRPACCPIESEKLVNELHLCKIPEEAIPDLLHTYETIPCMERNRFEAYVYFLEICAQSIYNNHYIRRDDLSISENFIEYVHRNLYQPITINQAADALNFSASHLSRIIAKDLGTTFTAYLKTQRMETAKNLLCMTNMSVNEIALLLCYKESSYFMRDFKHYTGVTCTTYRSAKTEAEHCDSLLSDH